jgi:NADH-quinone oxidoreductase subunit H
MAGWGSNNKYSILGAMRSAAQIISYEIPCRLCHYLCSNDSSNARSAGSSHATRRAIARKNNICRLLGCNQNRRILLSWNIFRAPHLIIAFVIYFIASLAESNRAPFDIPEAESELVAGFHTEFTGIRFALVFLAEYSMMFLVSMIGVILFLGAWNTPFPNMGPVHLADWTTGMWWGILWVTLKTLGLVAIQMWIRWTLPVSG